MKKKIIIVVIMLLNNFNIFSQKSDLFTIDCLINKLNNSSIKINNLKENTCYNNSDNWKEVKLYELFSMVKYKVYAVIYNSSIEELNENNIPKSSAHIVIYSVKYNKNFFIEFHNSNSLFLKSEANNISLKYSLLSKDLFAYDFVLTDDKFYNKIPVMINNIKEKKHTEFTFHSCENDYTLNVNKKLLKIEIDELIDFIISNKKEDNINECNNLQRLEDLQWMLPYYLRDKNYRNNG